MRWEPTNNCLERRRFQHLPRFFHAAHLVIIYIFGGSVKSHVLNARLAPTINPEDLTRRPRRREAANLRCEEQMGEPAVRSAQERRAEGVFPAASRRNVLAKLKTVIQTGIPTFEETMTGQRATSGAWSLVVWVTNTRRVSFLWLGLRLPPPPISLHTCLTSGSLRLSLLARVPKNIGPFSPSVLTADRRAERRRRGVVTKR